MFRLTFFNQIVLQDLGWILKVQNVISTGPLLQLCCMQCNITVRSQETPKARDMAVEWSNCSKILWMTGQRGTSQISERFDMNSHTCSFKSLWHLLTRCLILWELTHWPLGDLDSILKVLSSISFYWLVSSDLLMIMPSDECHGIYLKISQHWFR